MKVLWSEGFYYIDICVTPSLRDGSFLFLSKEHSKINLDIRSIFASKCAILIYLKEMVVGDCAGSYTDVKGILKNWLVTVQVHIDVKGILKN